MYNNILPKWHRNFDFLCYTTITVSLYTSSFGSSFPFILTIYVLKLFWQKFKFFHLVNNTKCVINLISLSLVYQKVVTISMSSFL